MKVERVKIGVGDEVCEGKRIESFSVFQVEIRVYINQSIISHNNMG